jgi:hypothetical protein
MSRIRIVFVVVVIAMAAGCSGSSPLAGPPVDGSGAVHLVSLAAGVHRTATLNVASGATSIEVGSANLSGRLITASTPPTSSQQPALAMSASGVAELQLTSAGVGGVGGGPSIVDVVLSSSVVWTINLDGGATEESVDMRGGHLALLNLSAGTTRATIDLPARAGTQVVREIGGASELTVSVPSSVSSRVQVAAGAGSVTIGTVAHSGVGGDQTFSDPGYGTASRRLDLELQGGVSSVVVRHG